MKKAKRILSFMMAIVMMTSAFSIVAQGRANYVDGYLTNYDDLDRPVVTFNQACTMVLDSLDVMLAKGNQVIDLSILGSLRLTSVNNALDDITSLVNGAAFTLLGWLVGDLNDLNVDAIDSSNGTPRRTTAQDAKDTDVLYAFVRFLNDNKNIIGKLIDGSISLGVASSAFDPADLNINNMVKGMLYGAAYPDAVVPETVTTNADTMVQTIITNLFLGKLDPVTGEYDGLAPELVTPVNYIDIVGTTTPAYDFIGTLLQQAWNVIVVPLLNTDLKKTVREACGVVYDPLLEEDPLYMGDASNLNEYAEILNIDYVIPTFTVPSGSTFIGELNNILASVVNELTVSYTWAAGANSNLLANLSAAAKYILNNTGGALFPDYMTVATPAEVNAMTDQQLFSYILRSLLNTGTSSLYIPPDADTIVEVVWFALKNELADKLPAIDYSAQPKTQAGVLYMLADLLAAILNETADMNTATGTVPGTGLVAYGQGLDATLLAATEWLRTNYLGLFRATFSSTDPWAVFNTLAFSILLQANWFPADVNGSSYELIINRLFGGALNLDINGILSLFARRGDSELATKTIKQILIDTVTRVINSIFPAAVGSFTTFDAIISNANLAVIVKNILTQLNTYKTSIMPVITPLLASSMKRSTPQAYQDPDIQLPPVVNSTTGSFLIRNDSTGINTGATDASGNFVRDNLYKISIVSVTSSIPAITLTNLAGTVLNGGAEVSCAIGGTFTEGGQLMVTVTYNVLTETGAVLTPVPLSQRAYAFVSAVVDDGTVATAVESNSENFHTMKYLNTYLNFPAAPEEPVLPVDPTPEETAKYTADHAQWVLDMAQYPIDRNASMQELKNFAPQITRDPKTSTGGHTQTATVSRGTATVNATLAANGVSAAPFTNISTNGDGGTWNPKYFTVSTTPTRPADGLYASNYVFTAGATKSTSWPISGKAETFTIPYKVVLYTDYDLPGILSGAISANRDPNNYSDQTAYNNYITAIKNAAAICYKPRQAATFMTTHAANFQAAATALKDAIKTLELSAISTGVTPLKTAMDGIAPPNTYEDPLNPGIKLTYEYDDPLYNYFGKEDYVAYTYNRYSDERGNAYGIWASQQLPEEPVLQTTPAPTPEQVAAFNLAHDQWVIDYAAAQENINPVKAVSVAYALNRFNLYAARLVRVPTVKTRLSEALTLVNFGALNETDYTTASWNDFERAYNFATSVNLDNGPSLRQTKVNTARENLIETWKELLRSADYAPLLAALAQAQALNQALYTPTSLSALTAALADALAVQPGLAMNAANQAIINAAAAAIQNAIAQLEAIIVESVQEDVVIDEINNFIFGLDLGESLANLLQASEGGTLVYTGAPVRPGTGTVVDLMNGETVIASYTIVVYGDLSRDGLTRSVDALMALQSSAEVIGLDGFQALAGDVNNSGTVTSIDALKILQYSAGVITSF